MRITIFTSALSGGGAERVSCNLANFLTTKGHNVELLTMGEAMPAETLSEEIKSTSLLMDCERSNPIFDFIKRIFRLRAYMKKEKVDAYIVFLPRTTILMTSFSHLTKTPIIMSERVDPNIYPKKIKRALRKACRKVDGIVFQTIEAQAWYDPSLKSTAYKVIPNAINPVFIRGKYEGEREKVIVGCGRLTEQKNFSLLISSFAKIADKFPEYKLVIYGKGNLLGTLKELANKKGIGDRVEFPGFISNMPETLEKASMFVLSSDYEGMPNALMEAMALGVPCVSTDCGGGGARFLIKDGENGLLVPQKDEEKMSAAIEKILSNKEFAERISNNSRKLQVTLAPDKIYGKWEEFIKSVTNNTK